MSLSLSAEWLMVQRLYVRQRLSSPLPRSCRGRQVFEHAADESPDHAAGSWVHMHAMCVC